MNQPDLFLRELGARLAEARNRAGLTQAEVAERIGNERPQTIGDQELGKGKEGMSITNLVALARLYKVSTDWLLGLAQTPQVSGSGGIVDLQVERAILGASTLAEFEAAMKRLDAFAEAQYVFGYEVPSEFEVLSDEEWESRRKAITLKVQRLKSGPGKRQQNPPPRRG